MVVLNGSGGCGRRPAREDHLCRLVITFRHTGNNQRDGPKLPYQTVVIRQSAMHLKGRSALLS